jgi:quinol monooxygenase YgiN
VTDLRTLAQAVVDARAAWLAVADAAPSRARAVDSDEWRAMLTAEGNLRYAVHDTTTSKCADVLLTALDAADAQGYARAMGEVVERCEAGMSHHGGYLSYHAFEDVADWAREQLPAAADRD